MLHKSFYWLIKNFSIYCHHFALSCAQIRAQFSAPLPLSCHTVPPVFIVFHTHSIARERAYYGVHGAVIAYFSKLFFIAHLLGAIAANGHDDWHFPPPLPGVSIHTLSHSWSHSCSCSPAMPIKFKSAGLLFLVRV